MKILAITDETDYCECCGKTNLKRVVVIERDNGDVVRYGTDCAGKTFRAKKADFVTAVEIMTYVQKWLGKTPAYTPELVSRGIQNKKGISSKVIDGVIYAYLGEWVKVG